MPKIIGNESKTVIKNIIISVVTTVTGAFAVYYLGFNNKGSGPSKLEMQERTVETWKTLVTVENIYTKNSSVLARDAMRLGNFQEAYSETERESKKFVNSLKGLVENEGIDKDLKSLIERRISNEESQLPMVKRFYDTLDSTINAAVDKDWTDQQAMDTIMLRVAEFTERTKGVAERSVMDSEALAAVLSERYDHPFNVEDFLIVQIVRKKLDPLAMLDDEKNKPLSKDGKLTGKTGSLGALANVEQPADYFAGTWDASGATITFEKNGKLTWVVSGNNREAIGTWKFEDTRLTMDVKNAATGEKAFWTFNLSGVEEKTFSMVLSKEPFNYYRLTKK